MARNRTIYQSENIYVGPTPCTGRHFSAGYNGFTGLGVNLVTGLTRVQNVNYSISTEPTPINQFGELAAIDYVTLDTPTITMDFTYIAQSLFNERIMGMNISSGTYVSAISGMLNKQTDEKNWFIKTVDEGFDSVGDVGTGLTKFVAGIGNGYLTSYRAEGAVGSFPTVRIGVEGINFKVDQGLTGNAVPSINPTNGIPITDQYYALPVATSNPQGNAGLNISALRPGDVVLDFGAYAQGDNSFGMNITDAKIQSYSIGFDLRRAGLNKLGSRYAYSREIEFPVPVSISVTSIAGEMDSGNLSDFLNGANQFDLSVKVHSPNTLPANRTDQNVIVQYLVRNARFVSQEFSHAIGSAKTNTLNFTAQVGGPFNPGTGMFLSGYN